MLMGQMIPYNSSTLFSPPFGRGGEQGTFYIDIKHKTGTAISMGIELQHKNTDDTSWGSAGNFSAITTTGLKSLNVSGLKEQLRYAYTFSAGSDGDFYWAEFPAPMWQVF